MDELENVLSDRRQDIEKQISYYTFLMHNLWIFHERHEYSGFQPEDISAVWLGRYWSKKKKSSVKTYNCFFIPLLPEELHSLPEPPPSSRVGPSLSPPHFAPDL